MIVYISKKLFLELPHSSTSLISVKLTTFSNSLSETTFYYSTTRMLLLIRFKRPSTVKDVRKAVTYVNTASYEMTIFQLATSVADKQISDRLIMELSERYFKIKYKQ